MITRKTNNLLFNILVILSKTRKSSFLVVYIVVGRYCYCFIDRDSLVCSF